MKIKMIRALALIFMVIALTNSVAFGQGQNPPPRNGDSDNISGDCADAAFGALERWLLGGTDEELVKDMKALNNVMKNSLNMDERQFESWLDSGGIIFHDTWESLQHTFHGTHILAFLIEGGMHSSAATGSAATIKTLLRVYRYILIGIALREAEANFIRELALWGGFTLDEARVISNEWRHITQRILGRITGMTDQMAGGTVLGLLSDLQAALRSIRCLNNMQRRRFREQYERLSRLLGDFFGRDSSDTPWERPRPNGDGGPSGRNRGDDPECVNGHKAVWRTKIEWNILTNSWEIKVELELIAC